jgi:hypothetical protein
MFDRGLRLVLCLAVLAATGVASAMPCCTLQQLSSPVSAEIRDCCESPDCCRLEKRGPAQAALSVKPPEVAAAAAIFVAHPLFLGESATALNGAFARVSLFDSDLPPPLDGRGTHLRISLFRI